MQMTFGETLSISKYVGTGLTGFDDCSLLFGDDLTGHLPRQSAIAQREDSRDWTAPRSRANFVLRLVTSSRPSKNSLPLSMSQRSSVP
jgi:hypothetical protein